ncbi:MAG: peptidoglycan-binding domain-containing protein, partial [Flavobacteriales bacterium]
MTIYKDLRDHNFDPDYDKVLQRGDYGPKVHALQAQLNIHGARLKPDGVYGPATRNAVIAFQRKHGLVAD